MLSLLEAFLVALTDAQFDRILNMVAEFFVALREGVKTLWDIASPLITAGIALYIATWKASETKAREASEKQAAIERAKAEAARKTINEKLDAEKLKSQEDRTQIITDLAENTKVTVTAIETANGYNAKIADLNQQILDLKKNIP